jgi:hypothetical protein
MKMKKKLAKTDYSIALTARLSLLAAFCLVVGVVLVSVVSTSQSAAPASGTVSESNPTVTWTGAILPANPDLLNSPRCAGANAGNCDNFSLTIAPPSSGFGPYVVEIRLEPQGDWDMEIYNPNGAYRTGSGNGAYAAEVVTLYSPPAGTYRIGAFPFSPVVGTDGNSYAASARLLPQPPSGAAPPGTENVAYANFACPAGQTCTSGFGEPSIGVNWKTGNVMFAGGGTLKTYRINNFNDQSTPASATWTNVSGNQHIATSPRLFADPILFTDPRAGRTFAGQLEGLTPFETMEYTDDDGNTFIPSQGSGVASGVDHETIGGGPLAPPLTRDPNLPRPAYPNGVYYCAQALGPANCALSLDGGQTFGPAVETWTTECGGLHGHIKVAPNDGTAYLPNKGCGGRQGMAVSTNNGITWTIRTIPGTSTGESDPSIGVATDGTVYFGFVDGDGHPKVAVSHDKGVNWDTLGGAKFIDVGIPFGIQNAVFSAIVAGDPNRAAFTFHGTPTAGAFQDASFTGVWDLYVAHTYDGGQTWTTVKATSDPTQRGCIWLGGGTNPCRNLLDFMDAAIDEAGRVVVGYADGCTGACATDPTNTAKSVWGTIARQSVGKRMFAAFDPIPPPTGTTFYFHGTPADEANKQLTLVDGTNRGTATWSTTAPTGTVPITQQTHERANHDFVGNPLAAYWRNSFSGSINGSLNLTVYLSTPNAEAAVFGDSLEVSVFADPAYVSGRVQPQRLIGRGEIPLSSVGPAPVPFTGSIAVNGTVQGELLIQVQPTFPDTGADMLVHYDSTSTASNFTVSGLSPLPSPTPTPSASPTPTPTGTPDTCTTAPSYSIHMSPPGFGDDWGEPSIGVNWKTEQVFNGTPNGGTVMSFGGFGDGSFPNTTALRIIFNDTYPLAPVATWEHTAPMPTVGAPRVFGDPILFTDHDTGRTFVTQLIGLTPLGSTTAITDDDGRNFSLSEGSGLPSSVDHETFGGGPFAAPLTGGVTHRNAVYYCSQSVADATCSLSIDGGVTFGPGVPIYTVNDCAGLHGHIKVSPKDGTAYIPNKGCGGDLPFHHNSKQAVVLSENNGVTWAIRPVTTSTGNGNGTKSDPSLGISTDGTLYFGYQANDGHPRIAVSKDKGQTWINDTDVGSALGIQTALFPAVVAGDPNRAAFAFFGTTTPGDNFHCGNGDDCSDDLGNNPQPSFEGDWHLYIATTYDGGLTWTTINATPGDPIQRGGICGTGTCRNLLDFFDATIDKEGRVLIGYDDGCISANCIAGGDNDFSAKNAIARQLNGKRMFAAFDSCVKPPPPPVCIEDNDSRVAYSAGWHLVDYASASGGHFRYHTGNSPNHSASLDFSIPSGSTGSITYAYAKSPKGGTADVYLDGVKKQTINYASSIGSTQAPEFKPEYNLQLTGLAAGSHKLEIKNLSGVVYVDQFCLTSSTITSQPTTGPGNTTNQSGSASAGQTASSNYQPQSGSQEMSVTVESSLNVPFKIALVNPSGLTVQTVDAVNGMATISQPVTQGGTYVIKVVNVSLGPLQFTTTVTPTITR